MRHLKWVVCCLLLAAFFQNCSPSGFQSSSNEAGSISSASDVPNEDDFTPVITPPQTGGGETPIAPPPASANTLCGTRVHGFQPGNCTIENNLIYNVDKGVHLKQSDSDLLDAHKVLNNIFVNMKDTAYNMGLQGSGLATPRNPVFANNIVYNSPSAVNADVADTSSQATGLKIYNNTLIKVGMIASIDNFINVEVYNNIFAIASNDFASSIGQPRVFQTESPGVNQTRITYFNNNMYFQTTNNWYLGKSTANEVNYDSLEAFRLSANHPVMTYTSPDSLSVVMDPLFVNLAADSAKLLKGDPSDLALQNASPALNRGRGGSGAIGAVRLGVKVGPL